MIIDCISDLHGFYPTLEGGDLLIVAGDLTATHRIEELAKVVIWINSLPYRKKILVAGNHDTFLQKEPNWHTDLVKNFDYLCDSETEFEGLKIWGTPWTKTFEGMNPHCKAFTCDTEEELAVKFSLIPEDTDILISHSPPYGFRDKTVDGHRVGSKSLQFQVLNCKNLKLWVIGHIHEDYGIELPGHLYDCTMVNASHVNEHYKPVNKPVRVIL